MGQSLSTKQLIDKISKAEQTLSSKPLNAAAFKRIGSELAPLAHAAATTTKLGSDGAFTRGKGKRSTDAAWFNVPLEARSSVHSSGYGVTIGRTRASAGPWRVAEDGRQAHVKGRRHDVGVTKSGRVKYKKSKATLGATEGFKAWTAASERMMAAAPARVTVHFTKAVMGVFQ